MENKTKKSIFMILLFFKPVFMTLHFFNNEPHHPAGMDRLKSADKIHY